MGVAADCGRHTRRTIHGRGADCSVKMDENDTLEVTRWLAAERLDAELRWLIPGLLAGFVVGVAYLVTHPYPAYGAGLYFLMAERIADAGYVLPGSIPFYTPDGIPFAYPPLLFYVIAGLVDLIGQNVIFLARVLPTIFTIAYLVPFYALARRLDYSPPQAGVATVLLAVSPPVLQWHLSAGGVVRAGAFLLAITGCYAGCRLFRSANSRWVARTAVLVGATALAHPLYLVFLLVSLSVFYLAFDRSVAGFARGAVVGVGGLLIAAPWWTTVISTHGREVYLAAAGPHGGIGDVITSLVANSSESPASALEKPYLHIPSLLAVGYLAHRRQFILPAWFASVALTVGKPRLLFFFGALLAAALLFDPVLPWLRRVGPGSSVQQRAIVPIVVILLLGSTVGVVYATGQLDAHTTSPSLPAFIDNDDREAMAWASENTAREDRFVVLGDAAEWFPYFTRRPIVVSPWGVEWVDAAQYERQLSLYKHLSRCERAECVTTTLIRANAKPEYVYVPTDTYTVRGKSEENPGLKESLQSSVRYRQVYDNDGVVIFRFVR